jgi:hypothetical protein
MWKTGIFRSLVSNSGGQEVQFLNISPRLADADITLH